MPKTIGSKPVSLEPKAPETIPKRQSPGKLRTIAFLSAFVSLILFFVSTRIETAKPALDSSEKYLDGGASAENQTDKCAELMREGYLIADCEAIPAEDLRYIIQNLGKIKTLSIKELLKIFNVSEQEYHRRIKPMILRDFRFVKGWKTLNPNMGTTAKPKFLVLIDPQFPSQVLYTNLYTDSLSQTYADDRL